ncbi:MAG: hypothetical protein LBT98_02610 [Puniceicoccales bacterium]|jgi:16S rRNA (adenine1518-N6/adenine1519-N6)-dimethyltransferase|nr:hypothetical protein [Puniceicoccales bacterium]
MDKNWVRRQLDLLGKRPLHSLGQHFLTDGALVQRCVEWSQLGADGLAVEIGPGLGTVTRALLERGARVHAVERDGQLADLLRGTLEKEFPGRLLIHCADALSLPLAGLSAERAGEARVVANLPFAISTPWLDALLTGPLPRSLTLFLQRETAERLLAEAPSRRRSALGVRLSCAYLAMRHLSVPPEAFHPRPRVQSQLVHWERRPEFFCFSAPCRSAMRHCFLNRRKLLAAAIRSLASHPNHCELRRWFGDLLGQGHSERTLRAEELENRHWQSLELLFRGEKIRSARGTEAMPRPGGRGGGN